jgi:hypothetical protein
VVAASWRLSLSRGKALALLVLLSDVRSAAIIVTCAVLVELLLALDKELPLAARRQRLQPSRATEGSILQAAGELYFLRIESFALVGAGGFWGGVGGGGGRSATK